MVAGCMPFFVIPLFLFYVKRDNINLSFLIFLILAGMIIGVSNYLRLYSGLAVLLMMVFMILIKIKASKRKKVVAILATVIGISVVNLHFNHLIEKRDAFLISRAIEPPSQNIHNVWHNAYLGFGFLHSSQKIQWNDRFARDFVRKKDPNIVPFSNEYNSVLKSEILRLIRYHPFFVLRTYFAKFGVMFFFFCCLVTSAFYCHYFIKLILK